jgi:hypothetical protein
MEIHMLMHADESSLLKKRKKRKQHDRDIGVLHVRHRTLSALQGKLSALRSAAAEMPALSDEVSALKRQMTRS